MIDRTGTVHGVVLAAEGRGRQAAGRRLHGGTAAQPRHRWRRRAHHVQAGIPPSKERMAR